MNPEGSTTRNRLIRRPPGSRTKKPEGSLVRRIGRPEGRPTRCATGPGTSGTTRFGAWQAVGRPRSWLRTPGRYVSHYPGGCPAERNTRLRSNPTPLSGPRPAEGGVLVPASSPRFRTRRFQIPARSIQNRAGESLVENRPPPRRDACRRAACDPSFTPMPSRDEDRGR